MRSPGNSMIVAHTVGQISELLALAWYFFTFQVFVNELYDLFKPIVCFPLLISFALITFFKKLLLHQRYIQRQEKTNKVSVGFNELIYTEPKGINSFPETNHLSWFFFLLPNGHSYLANENRQPCRVAVAAGSCGSQRKGFGQLPLLISTHIQ